MDAIGSYQNLGRNLDGDLTITFVIEDDPKLFEYVEELKDQDLLIEVSKLSKKHSNRARKYMWKLLDLMAKKLGSDKDTMYLMALSDAGVFEYIEVPQGEIYKIKPFFRYVEEIGTHQVYKQNADGELEEILISELRCYEGMHDYTSKELSDLINGIVDKCYALNIPTITEEEFRRLAGI